MHKVLRRSALVMVLVLATFTTTHGWQAEAYCISSIDAKCNPQVIGVFAAFGETAPGVVATTATVTTGTTALSAVGNAAAAVAVTAGGFAVGSFLWGQTEPPELFVPPGREPGWVSGDNVSEYTTTAYGTRTRWMEYRILSAPAYGANGALVYQRRCVFEAGGGSGGMASPNIGQLGNPSSAGTLGTSQCPSDGDDGYVYPGPWTEHTVSITAGFRRVSGVGVEWRPTGYPGEIDPGAEGGLGSVTATVECGNGVDPTHLVTESVSVSYEPGVEFDYPAPQCPAGEVVFGYGVTWTTSEGGEEVFVPWTETPGWVQNIPLEWPACLPGTACELTLWKGQGAPAEYCGEAAVGCPSWYTDINNLENYECRWGPYVVDLGYCNVFRNPGKVTPNTPTITDPKNGVRESGGAEPDTGLDVGLGEYVYDPQPDPTPFPYEPADSPAGECFPTGWGLLNPVEWVLKPIKCALVWAFVPRAEVVGPVLQDGLESINGTPPFSIVIPAASGVLVIFESITVGCDIGSMPNFDPEGLGRPEYALPCEPPIDEWDNGYNFMRLTVWVSTAWALWVVVSRGIGNKDASGEL